MSADGEKVAAAATAAAASDEAAAAIGGEAKTSQQVAVMYDLTATLGPFLDRHLMFPLLEFLQHKETYPEAELLEAKLQLLKHTNMVDFEIQIFKSLHPDDEEGLKKLEERRESVLVTLNELHTSAARIVQLLENEEVMKQLRQDKCLTLKHLESNYEITIADVDVLYRIAKFQFDCGNYAGASEYLHYFVQLAGPTGLRMRECVSALWGRFAADILMQDWDAALDDLNRLKDTISSKQSCGTAVEQLQHRTWLIHWSLFVFFNHPQGRNGILELFLHNDKYLNAIQTTCPHILRYLCTAVITNKRRRNVIKDMIRVLQQEQHSGSGFDDPITQFLRCLFLEFDFDGAQTKLRECEDVLRNDFFLVACHDEFMENARLFIFETYCRIHQCIDIKMLAEKLNMTEDDAERWIVNLIRNAELDAKIDSAQGHVIMGTRHPNVYQQVIEQTKGFAFRTYNLTNNLAKLER